MKKLLSFVTLGMASLASSSVFANTNYAATSNDPFADFMTTVNQWAGGPYGVGVGIASILVGSAIAVGKNSPMPALAGIGTAAFVKWGPGAVKGLVTGATLLGYGS